MKITSTKTRKPTPRAQLKVFYGDRNEVSTTLAKSTPKADLKAIIKSKYAQPTKAIVEYPGEEPLTLTFSKRVSKIEVLK